LPAGGAPSGFGAASLHPVSPQSKHPRATHVAVLTNPKCFLLTVPASPEVSRCASIVPGGSRAVHASARGGVLRIPADKPVFCIELQRP